jgi:hypothetical protein
MKTCKGQFSTEHVKLLREGSEKYGPSATSRYPCAVCGRAELRAMNYDGQWVPESHAPLPRKRAAKR